MCGSELAEVEKGGKSLYGKSEKVQALMVEKPRLF